MRYIAMGEVITDDILFADGSRREGQIGGVAYTVAGMRIWSEEVGLCGGIGEDFYGLHRDWFLKNKISLAGTYLAGEKGPRSRIRYFDDGEREESPASGSVPVSLCTPLARHIPRHWNTARGIYLYAGIDADYWDVMLPFLKKSGLSCIWELYSYGIDRREQKRYGDIMKQVAIVSLNRTEGEKLCGRLTPADTVQRLLAMGANTVLFRMGAQGSLVGGKEGIWHIPAVPVPVVDVTGGGNASTGGFLVGYCENGGDYVKAGKYAAVSASFILEQFGVPQDVAGTDIQKQAHLRASALWSERLDEMR